MNFLSIKSKRASDETTGYHKRIVNNAQLIPKLPKIPKNRPRDHPCADLTIISACAMGLVHQRTDKCVEKLIEIEENGSEEYNNFEKKCPEGLKNVYDIGFCVKVSELLSGCKIYRILLR